MKTELRYVNTEFRVQAAASGDEAKTTVRGYAALFNSWSEDLGGFREAIAPGAFDKVLGDDVRALYNHDTNRVLGRSKAGTLRLGVDEKGLWYEYDAPDTTYSRDLLVSMERGDVTQSSFGFTVAAEGTKWEKKEGVWYRTIAEVNRLYDVSPVTYPAYPDTTVAKRSLDQLREEEVQADYELENIETRLNLKLKF